MKLIKKSLILLGLFACLPLFIWAADEVHEGKKEPIENTETFAILSPEISPPIPAAILTATPLQRWFWAAVNGHWPFLQLTLNEVADINTRDQNQNTPLHIVVSYGHINIIIDLLNNTADLEALNIENETPLHIAAQNSWPLAIETLLLNGANIHALNTQRYTPLHLAAQFGQLASLTVLLNNGANIEALGENDYTPLHLAVLGGHIDTLTTLLDRGANINAQNSNQQTPLHLATKAGNTAIVEALLKRGANYKLENIHGQTAFAVATKFYYIETANVLKAWAAQIEAALNNPPGGHEEDPYETHETIIIGVNPEAETTITPLINSNNRALINPEPQAHGQTYANILLLTRWIIGSYCNIL